VAAAWVLLLCATTLLTASTMYGEGVALGGLRAAIAEAASASRSITVDTTDRAGAAESLDPVIRGELGRAISQTGGEIALITSTSSFADAAVDPALASQLTYFAAYEGIDRHALLATGRWAKAGAAPQEATLSQAAAEVLGLGEGDRLTLVGRRDPALRIETLITGLWRPDPSDPYWLRPDQEIGALVQGGSFATVGPFVVPEADLVGRSFGDRLDYEWRAVPDPSGYRLDDVAAVRRAVGELDERLRVAVPGAQLRITTGLPALLADVDRAALVSRTGILLLVVQFAVLAAYAIVLVAGMLADRRRAETALLRSRGASSGHLAAMALFEAVLLAGLAAALAPVVSLLVVGWLGSGGTLAVADGAGFSRISRDVLLVDGLTAVACAFALVVPTLGGGPNLAGIRAAIARQTGRTLAQRLGLDLALAALAAIALWQLRLYGAPLTRNARGILGIDPLLVAAPGIGLLAGAVIATRLIPRAAEIGQALLERGRGLVAPMGGRGLARRPLRYTRSALLLMLAAALGTFAAAHVATWTRSQADQAAYRAGADVRIEVSQQAVPARTLGAGLLAIPGVGAAMPVDTVSVDAGRDLRGGVVLAVDAAAAAAIVNPPPDVEGGALPGLFDLLAADRPVAGGVAIPPGSAQLAIVVDTAFESSFFDPETAPPDPETTPPDLSLFPGLRITVVVEDGFGRLSRLVSPDAATLIGAGQRLTIDLGAEANGSGAGLSQPLRLRALEFRLSAPFVFRRCELCPADVGVAGAFDVLAVEAAAGPGEPGAGWSTLGLGSSESTWSWRYLRGSSQAPYVPDSTAPWHVEVGTRPGGIDPVFSGDPTPVSLRAATGPSTVAALGAIASQGFMDATAAEVGDTVVATVGGTRQAVRVLGVVNTFPTLDPSRPFLVVDDRTLAIARFAAGGLVDDPDAWWLTAADPDVVAAAVSAGLDPEATIVTTAGLTTELSTDPVPLGVVGVLGLGSAAALIFAAIGFVVSATVSTRERLGEFALLRALGLSGRQLSVWLSLENAFLLSIGIGAGIGLGLVLAWLVLPFSTLTSSGAAAVPSPIVVIPWVTLLPIAVVAAGVFAATLLVLRDQLLGIRIGDVLRGRDE
jgi:GAF domain-containing protein